MSLLSLLLVGFAASESVLVVLDSWDFRDTHAAFLKAVEDLGHTLTYRIADSPHLKLEKYGEYTWDHVILAAASSEGSIYTEFGGKTTEESFLKYFDEGKGNLYVFADTDAAQPYRKLVNSFGMDIYEQGVRVYDDTKNVVSATVHRNFTAITSAITKPVSVSGTGFLIKRGNKLAFPLLTGSKKTKAQNDLKQKEIVKPEGEDIFLAVAFQGLNNARAVFLGGVDICANATWTGANSKFCTETVKWTFQKKGLLRYGNITHYRLDSESEAGKRPVGTLETVYRVGNLAYYSIDIEEKKEGQWVPHTGDKVYIEFVMLDPYIRKYLSREGKRFYTVMQLPDKYGVFQFKTKHDEPGFSWISTASEAPVRPYRHDEYERFLVVAYPYYLSVFASIGSFLLVSFYFIYHKE